MVLVLTDLPAGPKSHTDEVVHEPSRLCLMSADWQALWLICAPMIAIFWLVVASMHICVAGIPCGMPLIAIFCDHRPGLSFGAVSAGRMDGAEAGAAA